MKQEKLISTWAKALISAAKGKKETEKREIVLRLKRILSAGKKDYLLRSILQRAEKEISDGRRAELILGRKHDEYLAKKIKNFLPGIFPESSDIEIKIDQALIGGFRLKTQKYLVKASIKDFLSEIKSKVSSQ